MDPIHRLEYFFTLFPGVGSRQARRFVHYLLKQNPGHLDELSKLISHLHDNVGECIDCHRFFEKKGSHTQKCRVCLDTLRDKSLLLVVEKDTDLEAVERTHFYNGYYFVLGGTLPILEKNPDRVLRISPLRKLIQENKELKEIIIATAITPESEHTGDYVRYVLKDYAEANNIKITSLGRGVSTGSEIEYIDADTLKNALIGRK